MSSKRQRTPTPPSSEPANNAPEIQAVPLKLKRASLSSRSPRSCLLPPTCNPPHPPTVLNGTKEFEQHYATFHTHVCTAPEIRRTPTSSRETQCGKVFPDARYLDLHLSECHDPLVAVRMDRGERTFACFVETCDGLFSSPKGRRLHLIDAHGYPKEFYFSVTSHGVGDLLGKWGQAASLLRKEWKPREPSKGSVSSDDKMEIEPTTNAEPGASPSSPPAKVPPTKPARDVPPHLQQPVESKASPAPAIRADVKTSSPSADVDDLTSGLSSLALVPPSIRFGRGGKAGGFIGGGKALGSGKRPSRGTGTGFGVVKKDIDVA